MRPSRCRIRSLLLLLAAGSCAGIVLAAQPPQTLHYQGVLRDAADAPRNGNFDMVFRFFDAATGGSELLIDRHLTINSQAVAVVGGTFDAAIGAGELLDGAGPGSYGTLSDVFSAHAGVWMEIQIGAETLVPRVQVHSAPFALNADRLSGMDAGAFLDLSSTAQTKAGTLVVQGQGSDGLTGNGIEGYGYLAGGYFESAGGAGRAWLGGYASGGEFYYYPGSFSGRALLAHGDRGIEASGDEYAGYFSGNNDNAYVYLGRGNEGVQAYGTVSGGYFQNLTFSGRAVLAEGDIGMVGWGSQAGGYFYQTGTANSVNLAGNGFGVDAVGSYAGAQIGHATGSGIVLLASSDIGVFAGGNSAGGFFYDPNSSGQAWAGYGDRGVWGKGSFAGATFSSVDNVTYWADVATPTRKIVGTGTVSFVQNHPHDVTKVIVYAAPEGDEVATYTRGSGRLVDGVARIDLGPTFPLVTNPEYGLTAQLTPRDEPVVLVAETVTSHELVVRGPSGSKASFDYVVHGLRLGFEDAGVIVSKSIEAVPPSAASFAAERGSLDPAASATAGAKFRAMGSLLERDASAAPGEAAALQAAVVASASRQLGKVDPDEARQLPRPPDRPETVEAASLDREATATRTSPAERSTNPSAAASITSPAPIAATRFSVAPGVRAGDALAVDPAAPWRLIAVGAALDPTVVGIAAGDPVAGDDGAELVEIATSGLAQAHVDAGYGEIAIGDLLVASATPGHLMRTATLRPGTVVAKALEPWTAGSGEIRVLVMPR